MFRCHDPNLDRYVAVKVLPSFHTDDPTFTARFSQEAQTVAKLNHPNILQIYDFGEDKGFTYIVSELVLGGDLQDMLEGTAMPALEVLKFMGPLAEALDYAHAAGIVHRDLKPANVLLDNDGRAILADFGLARMLESTTRFTQASQALGTPEYMAPEQAMGADADHRSDLYAFGVMIYQMLLGETPFRADTPAATLMAHVPQPLPTSLNPDIEPRMEAILLKALKTPDDRFQSAREMIQALAQASDQVKEAAEGGDIGATAVLDLAAINPDDMLEAPTAVMDAAAGPAETAAVSAPSAEAEAPAGKRNMLLIGAGVAVAVVIAAVAAVAVLGGGDGDEDPVAPAAGAASAPAQAAAAPQAPAGAGGAAAAVAGATAVAEETAAPAAEPTITPEPTAPPLDHRRGA